MRHGKILRKLVVAVLLPLLLVLIPATPAWAAPVVALSPTSGAVGTEVAITGTNFESYAGDYVSVFFDKTEIDGTIIPDNGTFTLSFRIPDDTEPGRAYITVEDEYGNRLGEKRPFIIEEMEIELYPMDGAVDTIVAITGKGFYADERVTFYYNGTKDSVGSEMANSLGEVAYHLTVPESAVGVHEISAQDTLGSLTAADFKVTPSAAVDPALGAMGDRVTVSGTGFKDRVYVTISLDDIELAKDKTDKLGSFETICNVPVMKPDTYEIEVEDDVGNIAKAEFIIGAGVSLSPITGNVGTPVIVNGTGFTAGKAVTVTYDNQEVATAVPNGNGTFSVIFNVPASIRGNHPITITDGVNIIKRTFTMESEAPPVAKLSLPEEAVEAEGKVYFDWEEVEDPSGVTYTLQVAADEDFTDIELEEEELTDSEFTLPEETLVPTKKEAPYYWRVKAIDGASNEGEWSTPRSFHIKASFALPKGAIYALIVLGFLGLAFLAFWLGRRTAYYRRP